MASTRQGVRDFAGSDVERTALRVGASLRYPSSALYLDEGKSAKHEALAPTSLVQTTILRKTASRSNILFCVRISALVQCFRWRSGHAEYAARTTSSSAVDSHFPHVPNIHRDRPPAGHRPAQL